MKSLFLANNELWSVKMPSKKQDDLRHHLQNLEASPLGQASKGSFRSNKHSQ